MNVKKLVLSVGGIVLFLLFVYHSIGGFEPKISPEKVKGATLALTSVKGEVLARMEKITPHHRAIGSVSSQKEISISSQVRGVVARVHCREGSPVAKGDLLVEINDEEFKTRLEQARRGAEIAEASYQQAIQNHTSAQAGYARILYDYQGMEAQHLQSKEKGKSAQAAFESTEAQYNRVKSFKEKEAATQRDLEQARSQYLQAKAALEQTRLGIKIVKSRLEGMKEVLKSAQATVKQAQLGIESARARLEQSKQFIKEAEIFLSYTRIQAPDNGVVVKKFIEPGDLAWPGKPLVQLHKPELLQMESEVPESLKNRVSTKDTLDVLVESVGYKKKGTVRESIPSADPRSRTFLIKVAIPYSKDLYPGMFGTLLIPLDQREVILISERAIQRIGQFESIYVKSKNGQWNQRFITTGRAFGKRKEVLSGLNAGETLALLKEEQDGSK